MIAKYRLLLLNTWGDRVSEVPRAALGSFGMVLNDMGAFDFTLPNSAFETRLCEPGKTEVQILRGEDVLWWGVITRASGDQNETTFQCQTLEWYLSRRVIGAYPLPDLIDEWWNLPDGKPTLPSGWAIRRDPYVKRYSTDPNLFLDWYIVSETYRPNPSQPLPMREGDSMLLLTAWSASTGMMNKDIRWTNPYSKDVTVHLVVWVYLVGTDTTAHAKGVQLSLIEPGVTGQKKTSTVKFGKHNKTKKWTRVQCSIAVPADGTEYIIRTALYGQMNATYTSVAAYYSNVHLVYPVYDEYVQQDQTYIAYDLLRKSQDLTKGKGPMGSGINWWGDNTSVKRTRTYLGSDRQNLYEALYEWPGLDNGFDLNIYFDPAGVSRWLRSYYPRRGADKSYVLSTESNISDFSLDVDAETLSNQIIVVENVDDVSKREGTYRGSSMNLNPPTTETNPRRLLEMAYTATPGSVWTSLNSQARRGYIRYSKLVRSPSLTMSPEYTDELLATIELGDRVRVVIDDGWLQADEQYRIVEWNLDPETDQITYTVSPEDVDA